MKSVQYDIQVIKEEDKIKDLMFLVLAVPELEPVDRETLEPTAQLIGSNIIED